MSKKVKTIVGVDPEGTFASGLSLCKRLQFAHQNWTLANTIPPLPWYVPGIYPRILPIADSVHLLEEASKKILREAHGLLQGNQVAEETLEGDVAASLMRFADLKKADLLVLGSGQPKHGVQWLIGSVARALGIGAHQSLLVGKGPQTGEGPIHAVFATDHSEYANRAVEQLIRWAPKGFSRIDVLTAYDIHPATIAMLRRDTDVALEFDNWVHDHALKQSEKLAKRLKTIAPEITTSVERGDTNEVIRKAMEKSGADLLILAAQGHGFFDRLLIGSTSHHQLVAEPYPVLLLRLPAKRDGAE